jgi:hypothetical protein
MHPSMHAFELYAKLAGSGLATHPFIRFKALLHFRGLSRGLALELRRHPSQVSKVGSLGRRVLAGVGTMI